MIKKLLNGGYTNKTIIALFFVFGLLIYRPYINNHFNYDDFIFVSALEEKIEYNQFIGFWDIDFRDIPSFNSMWWTDPDAEGTFFRPLPTLVFSTFFKIFGRDSALYLHLFYFLMHILAAYTGFIFLKKLTNNYAVSLLAAFMFLICVHNSMTVGWISTGTDIICVVFINLASYNYVIYRLTKNTLNQIYSVLCLLIALCCKETAVIVPASIVLIEFFYFTDGSLKERLKKLLHGARHIAPAIAMLIAFLVFYKVSGFGVKSIMYNDVFENPSAYFGGLVAGYPIMFLGYLSIAPFSLYMFMPELKSMFIAGGLFLSVVLIYALWKDKKDMNVQYMFIMFIISILPQLSVDASERQLYYPYVLGSFLVSMLIFRIPFLNRLVSESAVSSNGILRKTVSYYLLVSSVLVTIPYSFINSQMYSQSLRAPERYVKQAIDAVGSREFDRLLYLNTPGSMLTLYINDIHRYYRGRYEDITLLSSFGGKLWMRKNSDSSISLKTDKTGMLTGMFQRLVRTSPLVEQNRIYKMKDYEAKIISVTNDLNDVLEIKFDFYYNLNDPSTVFIHYDGDKLKLWDFAGQQANEWILIGDSSDIMKSMM